MGLDKLGEKQFLDLRQLFNNAEKKENQQPAPSAVQPDAAKLNEQVFTGNLQKEIILQKFKSPDFVKTEQETPVDYFDVDQAADELIKKHTEDGLFSDSLNTDALGEELAETAQTDPERAAALTDNILDKIDGGDKDELAQSFTESMTPAELREFAKTEKGKETLEQLKQHLDEGWTTGDEDATIARIETATKAADFQNSEQFKNLSPEAQIEVLNRFDANQGNNAAVDNLINLVTSGEFAKMPIESQRSVLQTYDNHKEDQVFVNVLKDTLAKPEFQALNAAQQAQVLSDLDKIADTETYKGEGGLFGHDVSDEDKTFLLDSLGNSSIYSAAHPNEVALRNTLDKITNGEIRVEAYSEAADPNTGGITLGYTYSEDVIYMNSHPDTQAFGANVFTDTLVHEVNHNQNPGGEHGTPDQFLNEYRAFYVGNDAVGNPPSADQQKDIIDNLLASYPDIKDLYDNNADFKKFIDDAQAGLDKTPPELLDPETVRQNLLDAGFSSDYLNTTGNVDNH